MWKNIRPDLTIYPAEITPVWAKEKPILAQGVFGVCSSNSPHNVALSHPGPGESAAKMLGCFSFPV